MKKTSLLLLAAWAVHVSLYAQMGAEALYLKKSTSLQIDISGNNLQIQEHHVSEKKFLKNFEKHASESIYYSDFDPITNLEATTLVPAKSGFKKTRVTTIETEDIFQPGIFYGGYKRRNFIFPMLVSGSIGRLEYSKQLSDVHLVSPFYFDEDIPVASSEYSVTIPSGVKIRYKLFGNNADRINMMEKKSGDKTIYTWSLTDVPAFKQETAAPSRSYTAPHIIVYVESFETKGGKEKVLTDVSDLYNWYETMVKKIPDYDQKGLQQLVADLTKGIDTNTDKTRVIFQWVQHNIKYIAFENGMAGFIPRSSGDVFTKRYGDCKDMANLLKDMLTMAGVEAHLAWIGTRSKPYTYQDVPTAIADNHMICSVKRPDGYIFLDATNPFLSFGKPSSMIQNKEALIGMGAGRYEVVKVPVVSRNENQRNDTVRISLQPNGIKGEFKSMLTGFRKDDMEVKHLKASINNDREYIRDFFAIGDNNISLDKLAIKGLGDQNSAARIDFDFLQPGYIKNVGDRIYVNLHLNKSTQQEKLDLNSREQWLEQDYCFEDHSVTILTLPEGYNIASLPQNVSNTWKQFGVSAQYKIVGRTIVMKKTIYSDYLYLDKSLFQDWNSFIDAVNAIHQQSVALVKIK